MASVHLCGPQVASAAMAKPASADGLRIPALSLSSRAVPTGRRFRGLVVRAATVVSPKGYTDSDWQGDLDERKSTSGYLFLLAGGAISWKSKKQSSVALSSMEAEYIAASEAVKESNWLRDFLVSLEIVETAAAPVTIYCDNQAAIKVSKDPKFHSKSKHIEARYHYIRDVINRLKTVKLQFLPSTEMLADPLTKSLSQELFCKHVRNMGLRNFD